MSLQVVDIRCVWTEMMSDMTKGITARLAAARDCWLEAGNGLRSSDSLGGVLPASRALPDCARSALAAVGAPER